LRKRDPRATRASNAARIRLCADELAPFHYLRDSGVPACLRIFLKQGIDSIVQIVGGRNLLGFSFGNLLAFIEDR
jgi:ATP/maltotriose-dependent transcriptional regulator MalT